MYDEFWEIIQPYFPPKKAKTGRLRANLRNSFNGILYVLKAGITWMDDPRMYGDKSTIHRLHLELCERWTYEKIFDEIRSRGYLKGNIGLSRCNIDIKDSTSKKVVISAMNVIKRLNDQK
jgi:putative transposase